MAIHTVSLCAPLNEQQYPGIALTGHVVLEAQRGKGGETGESLQEKHTHPVTVAYPD